MNHRQPLPPPSYNNYSTTIECTEEQKDPSSELHNWTCVSDQDYLDWLEVYVFPTPLEWAWIPFFFVLFIVGIVGNFLVCYVVVKNPALRTVTNLFLVNLAVADFLVILLCLPSTILWDVTETWFFGTIICKATLYVQVISVSVSILTLTAISVERWYAICHPLAFKTTLKRTIIIIGCIWVISLTISLPEPIVLTVEPHQFSRPNFTSIYVTQCVDTWGYENQRIYQLCQTIALFLIPFILMAIMYGDIAKNLWFKEIPSDDSLLRKSSSKFSNSPSIEFNNSSRSNFDQRSKWSRDEAAPSPNIAQQQRGAANRLSSKASRAHEKEIMSRRKVAKMLIAVVVLFGICYLPHHCFNFARYWFDFGVNEVGTTWQTMITMITRFLCYFNSCINPIIYNFMSEKFKKEFRRACICKCHIKRGQNGSITIREYSLMSACGNDEFGSDRNNHTSPSTPHRYRTVVDASKSSIYLRP